MKQQKLALEKRKRHMKKDYLSEQKKSKMQRLNLRKTKLNSYTENKNDDTRDKLESKNKLKPYLKQRF